MILYRVLVSKGFRGYKVSKDYNVHYRMTAEIHPSIFRVSGYLVPNSHGEAESGNTNYHDIQCMYAGNIPKNKYVVDRAFNYDFGDVTKITKLKDA